MKKSSNFFLGVQAMPGKTGLWPVTTAHLSVKLHGWVWQVDSVSVNTRPLGHSLFTRPWCEDTSIGQDNYIEDRKYS